MSRSRTGLRSRWVVAGLVAVGLLAARPEAGSAQAGRAEVREGNRLYEQGLFDEAHQKYLEGLAAAPESGVIRYNDANALYRSDDFQRASDAYRRAIESGDPAVAASAWYNLGNALYRQQQLEASLEAYKQALRLRPDDVDAKHNLERVLQQLQQQQDQQQNQDQQQQDQQNQDQQQDQQQQNQDPQQQQQDQQQDQQQQQDPQGGDQPPPEPRDERGQGEPERRPGQMTPEEAERLLGAVREDPADVDRRRAPVTGRLPRRPW